MRIESSSIQLAGASTSVEKQTKEESLKTWLGSTRPDFEGKKPIFLNALPQNVQQSDTLQLSAEGKAALEKQMSAASTGSINEEDQLSDLLSEKDKQKILTLQKMIEAITGKRFKFVLLDNVKLDKINYIRIT
jgi:hypothetical protein